jgi:chorismate synthase
MAGNSIGNLFRITTFGESHGPFIGVVVDGCPSNLVIDEGFIQEELQRRRPGQSSVSSERKELDAVKILSGVWEGRSTGAPIALLIENKDVRSKDYANLKEVFRPSHADYTYSVKYGIRDHRGGGRSSARETAARVAGGSIAKLFLNTHGIKIQAYTHSIGPLACAQAYPNLESIKEAGFNPVKCPDQDLAEKMVAYIEKTKAEGDSCGGIVHCIVENLPAGLGDPVFDKLSAALAYSMMGINAVKGFEIGSGFGAAQRKGSENNDLFTTNDQGHILTETNYSGGIQGGISNGMPLWFRVAFKPVSTLLKEQKTLNTQGKPTTIKVEGRHDPCVVPRAIPIVEAMTALTLADHLLKHLSYKK